MSRQPAFLGDERIPADIAVESVRCCVCGGSETDVAARGYDYEYKTSRREWIYRRCRACALVYVEPRPATSELRTIYPSNYYSFDENKRTNPLVSFFRRKLEAMKARAFAKLAGSETARVLDVGCGDGRFLGVLRDYGPKSWVLEGIDIDSGAIERARAKGLEARCTRLEDFEPAGGRYDLVVLFQTLEHVSEPRDMCRKIHALLEPGGLFLIETPDVAGWDERLFRGSLWGGYHIPRHWNLFTPANLERMLADEGFDTVLKQPLISSSFWINSLYNWLLVRRAPEPVLRFFHYQNPLLLAPFIAIDKLQMLLGGRTSNQRLVARKRA